MLKPEDQALVERAFGKPVMLDEEGEDWGALLDAARAEGAAALRDALLSEEVVEAGARGLTGARWEVGHRILEGEKLSAKETARIESHATLSAALAVLLKALDQEAKTDG